MRDTPAADANQATPDWAQVLVADLADRGLLPGSDVHVTGITTTVEFGSGTPASWQPATAVLRSITEVPLPAESLPDPTASTCVLALDVLPPGGVPYSATVRQGFRDAQRRAAIAVIGATLPVRIDPHEPQHVALDVPAFDRQHRQAG